MIQGYWFIFYELPNTVHATIFFFKSHSLLILLARVQCMCVRRQGRIKGTNPAMVPCSMNIAVFKAPQHPQFRGRRASKGRKRVDKMQVIESCNCLTQVIFAIAIQSFVILSKVNLVWILMNLSKSVPAWKRGEFFYTDWRCSILELVNQTKYIFNKNSIGK